MTPIAKAIYDYEASTGVRARRVHLTIGEAKELYSVTCSATPTFTLTHFINSVAAGDYCFKGCRLVLCQTAGLHVSGW